MKVVLMTGNAAFFLLPVHLQASAGRSIRCMRNIDREGDDHYNIQCLFWYAHHFRSFCHPGFSFFVFDSWKE
ncbi:hypothetical protein C8Q75DRAFT_765681 [Abortiporus biennis]|nr:hypothetical protein C8Q75DRAFT_765681 [Abortiporus biennis]